MSDTTNAAVATGTEPRDLPFARPVLGEEEKAAVVEVLSGHMLTHGPRCAEFERRFAELIGVEHAVTMSSCTTALHLSLMALDIGPGDEVIVPAETHVATAHAVEHCGARPIFADVERETGNIDPERVRAAITAKTRAIMPVHYLGLPCEMDALTDIAGAHGLAVIEDCALAIGASYDGRAPGSFGATGCFSFYPTKHMTTMEGGMLVTGDAAIAARVRKLRAFGYDKQLGQRSLPGIYDIDALGYNFRMSEGQAAIGLCQMDRLDGFLERRRRNGDKLLSLLADIDGVVTFPVTRGKAESGRYCVNVTLPEGSPLDRGDFIRDLNDAGVGTSVHYPIALPYSRYYRDKYGAGDGDFPVAKWISERTVSLPIGPHLDPDDMSYIAEAVDSALGNTR